MQNGERVHNLRKAPEPTPKRDPSILKRVLRRNLEWPHLAICIWLDWSSIDFSSSTTYLILCGLWPYALLIAHVCRTSMLGHSCQGGRHNLTGPASAFWGVHSGHLTWTPWCHLFHWNLRSRKQTSANKSSSFVVSWTRIHKPSNRPDDLLQYSGHGNPST